jgi:hypothetical protein
VVLVRDPPEETGVALRRVARAVMGENHGPADPPYLSVLASYASKGRTTPSVARFVPAPWSGSSHLSVIGSPILVSVIVDPGRTERSRSSADLPKGEGSDFGSP